ncbi:hypothetical protein CLG96_05930 [Sphingomonas oleivorans]|uniref:PD(D/E)XK endonuclease domain-containing protein n=1 Tax=Sphingomonas oleivorans TaxID=1735121 RepID=A0A2T5FZH5_9SPHN|nr:hypothetical protein [Sphingomonas oleivorans]PTQ12103.1 hypothetical protein CLG96_05930 [Sphingomonas oleivorans]
MAKFRGEVIEVINRNALISLALTRGYVAYLPVYDPGIDLILYSEATDDVQKVQLKSRLTIAKKYQGRSIAIAFPDRGSWYLVPHDELVRIAEAHGYTASRSWIHGNEYSVAPLSKKMAVDLESYRFQSLEAASEKAAEEAGE